MHHIWIKQAWSRIGPNQLYDDVLANEGLRRFGNGFWNLIPLPHAVHSFITIHPIAAPLFASTVYVLVANAHEHWGIIEFMSDVYDNETNDSVAHQP